MSIKSAAASKARRAKPIPPVTTGQASTHPAKPVPQGAAPARTDAAERSLPGSLLETLVQLVPYPLLARAPENVRHTRVAEDVESLADDIAAHGLLQSLIGYQNAADTICPAGFTWIVGGGRRLAALDILHDRGVIDDAYRVPVVVRDVADAIELSLSENLARRDMSPVDEFIAFEQLMRPGTMDAAGLAKRFGFSERYVRQRLRLAQLAPEILDALRDRKLTLDAAEAYATSQDRDLQKRVFAVHARVGAYRQHQPEDIRRDLFNKVMKGDSPIALYVGAEAYEAAGGLYDDDLFANPLRHESRELANGALARQLAADKIAGELIGFVSAKNKAGAGINAGAVIAPDLEVWSWQWIKPKPPAGFVAIECQYDKDKRWNAARNCGAQVKGVVGLDLQGRLILIDNFFFVDKDKAKEIKPPEPAREVYRQPTAEEYEERRRQGDLETWSRRLALGGFEDTKFAGFAFWPADYDRGSERATHPALGEGYLVNVRLFVSAAEAEAQLDAAAAKLDAIKADRLAKEAAETQRLETSQGAGVTRDAREAAIAAMDPEPAVLIADGKPFFRWSDGSYMDNPSEGGDSIDAFDELTQMLAEADTLGRAFATIGDYDAACEGGFDPALPDPYDDELDDAETVA